MWYRRLDMNGKILEETQPGLNPEGYVSIPFLFQGQSTTTRQGWRTTASDTTTLN